MMRDRRMRVRSDFYISLILFPERICEEWRSIKIDDLAKDNFGTGKKVKERKRLNERIETNTQMHKTNAA